MRPVEPDLHGFLVPSSKARLLVALQPGREAAGPPAFFW